LGHAIAAQPTATPKLWQEPNPSPKNAEISAIFKYFRPHMKEQKTAKSINGIRDNFSNGSVGEFLVHNIEKDSNLSFVTAYFTIYAYDTQRQKVI
jgi:hypothetical protein